MGIKNFVTGVLVQKFDQGSENCVQVFFQKRTLTRRPLALEFFTPTKFAKNMILQHKGNAVWSQNQISAKNPNVKQTFFEILLFREILLQVSCHVSRRKKSMSFWRISTFLVQKTLFGKVRFWLVSVTILIFSKTQNYYKKRPQWVHDFTSISWTWDEKNENGKFTKSCLHQFSKTNMFDQHWT